MTTWKIRQLGNPFRRRPRECWYLVCDHPSRPAAFVFGPFRSEAKALDYPNTFGGFVDAPAFRHPITTRVVLGVPAYQPPAGG